MLFTNTLTGVPSATNATLPLTVHAQAPQPTNASAPPLTLTGTTTPMSRIIATLPTWADASGSTDVSYYCQVQVLAPDGSADGPFMSCGSYLAPAWATMAMYPASGVVVKHGAVTFTFDQGVTPGKAHAVEVGVIDRYGLETVVRSTIVVDVNPPVVDTVALHACGFDEVVHGMGDDSGGGLSFLTGVAVDSTGLQLPAACGGVLDAATQRDLYATTTAVTAMPSTIHSPTQVTSPVVTLVGCWAAAVASAVSGPLASRFGVSDSLGLGEAMSFAIAIQQQAPPQSQMAGGMAGMGQMAGGMDYSMTASSSGPVVSHGGWVDVSDVVPVGDDANAAAIAWTFNVTTFAPSLYRLRVRATNPMGVSTDMFCPSQLLMSESGTVRRCVVWFALPRDSAVCSCAPCAVSAPALPTLVDKSVNVHAVGTSPSVGTWTLLCCCLLRSLCSLATCRCRPVCRGQLPTAVLA